MIEELRIPEDRLPVLIGKKGRTKKAIEELTETSIEVSDWVKITGEDPLKLVKARDMVKAIGRGFSPEEAERLIEHDCNLHVISLNGETYKKRTRLLGRVIGNKGRSKRIIENETGASIAIKGKTVSIIGTPGETAPAEEALLDLLAGKTHAYAYKDMNKHKK
ncbi:MAG: RNA-processing protein [Candidatus Aenigmatarchaeota archaeon]|nr:MAG: RNA-processing protein [Candidatus Aenigmarchaeota archaeon]